MRVCLAKCPDVVNVFPQPQEYFLILLTLAGKMCCSEAVLEKVEGGEAEESEKEEPLEMERRGSDVAE